MKKPTLRPPLRSRKLAFEPLEPRALLSADLLPVAMLPEPPGALAAEFRAFDAAAAAPAPVADFAARAPRELVFIDAGVGDAAALASAWSARGAEVVLLDPGTDAIDGIGAVLAQRTGLDAVHLVTHGRAGALELGGATLDAAALTERAADVSRWADAFAAHGDLLLYGCDVAGDAGGRAFAERLALLTGADVAASTDRTGAAPLGGDWSLEYAHGFIEAASLPPAHGWFGVLAADTLDWDAVAAAGQWPDSSMGANAMTTALGGTVTGTLSGDTAFLVEVGGGDARITPVVNTRVNGGTFENTLQLQADGFDNVQSVMLTLDFSAFAFGVSNISFTVFDVDSGTFIDRVRVTTDRGDPVSLTPSLYNGVVGTNAIVGNGTGNSSNNAADGNAGFSFGGVAGIRILTIDYGNDGGPTGQGIGIHDLTFDATPGASDRTVTTGEDQAYTFAAGDFGFADYGGDTLQGVRITALPGAGSLLLNGVGVAPGQDIAAADIALGRLTFQPAAEASGAPHATFRFRVSDGTSLSVADYGMAIDVTPVNDAPVLDAGRTPVLAPATEDAGAPVGAVGTLVSALVDFALPGGQVDNVTDPDAGALLGIALTGADTSQGSWFYSLNGGGTWSALPAVSASNALLLAADAGTRLYFQPGADYAGTLANAITFRAWDRTGGAAGSAVDPGAGGGSSAFSTASDTASLVVTAVNDAPTLGNVAGDARGYAAGAGAVVVDQGAAASVADVDSADFDGGSLVVTIAAGEVTAEDVLAIATGPSVSLAAGMTVGSTVSVGGVAIGTITADGTGGADLAVSLNANATSARVATLLQAITYANTDAASPTPGSRTVRFTLSDGDGGTATPVDATVTVKPVASIAATDAAAAEPGDDGRFTVSLSGASATDTVITYTVTGTAANGTDYTLIAGPITLLAGATTAFIDIAVIDDLVVESAETVTVTLTGVSTGDADIRIDGTANGATVTIAAGDSATLTVADASVNEGAGTISFSVTVDRAVQGGFSVDALFGGGTATGGGVDYASATQTLVFAGTAGETQLVTLAITDDAVVEANETFTVSLGNLVPVSAPPGAFTFTDTATGTVVDNDTATLTVADASVNEGAGTISFSVTVDRAVQGGFSVDALFGGGTATGGGTDYASATQTLVFAGNAGETQLVTLAITDDAVVEADETFTVSLGNLVPVSAPPGAFILTDTATGTLLNDDGAPDLPDTAVGLPENSPGASLVIDLSDAFTGNDTDADGDPLTYAIVAGNASGAFAIDPSTGAITVASPAPLDFETNPVFTLTVLATDGTNPDTATITVNLQNVNEAPVATVPAAQTVAEDGTLVLSALGGGALAVADVDAAALQVTLTATHGVLDLATLAGLAFSAGDGSADAVMTFSGSVAAVNAALDGLQYRPAPDYHGPALVSMLVDDLGQSGLGGAQTAAASVAVAVTPVNDPPSIAGDLALVVLEGGTVTLAPADLAGVDRDDAGAGLVFDLVAAPGRGRLEFADAPGLPVVRFTQADLDAGRVRYVHDGTETTADAFGLQLTDGGEDGAGPAGAILNVVIVPVNDAPALATGGAEITPGARLVLTPALVSASDPDSAADSLLFTLDAVFGGYVEVAGAAGGPVVSFTGAQLREGLVRYVQTSAGVTPAFRVSVSDGEATDGPRIVVLTLRGGGYFPQDERRGELAPPALTAAGFRGDPRTAELRSPESVPYLRPPATAPAAEVSEVRAPAALAPRARVAGDPGLAEHSIEIETAGLRFAPPTPDEAVVPRVDFSFAALRPGLEDGADPPALGLATADAARVAGLALTAGGVWWIFRMAGLIGGALVSAPAWRHIDPLPVLGGGGPDPVEWGDRGEDDAESPERYFEADPAPKSPRG